MPYCKHSMFTTFLLIVLYAVSACAQPAESIKNEGSPTKVETGIAVTPRNFPSHTLQDIDQAFKLATELADYAVFIYQWRELNMNVVRMMIEKAGSSDLKPILGLSPTTLDQGRKELDLPSDIRGQAGSLVSFANPVIRKAFIKSAKELAGLRPAYLCLATEINFLAMQRLPEFLHFASLYQEAYVAVKKISPQTKVFVSFQWEWLRILDAKEPNKIKEHSKLIDIFRPRLDVVGFTTYPSPFHKSPSQLPPDYYSWMYHHIQGADEVLLMEVGWPTQGTGTELEQQTFIQLLPKLLNRVNVSVIAWALLHDVGLAVFDANLNTVGLITSSGRKKPGFADFKNLHDSFR